MGVLDPNNKHVQLSVAYVLVALGNAQHVLNDSLMGINSGEIPNSTPPHSIPRAPPGRAIEDPIVGVLGLPFGEEVSPPLPPNPEGSPI